METEEKHGGGHPPSAPSPSPRLSDFFQHKRHVLPKIAYLQGLSLGLAYVAPIGVQNLFVINAGLSQPRAAAYRTALIVIFFDVTLALAGFFGIGALIEHSELIRKGVLLAGSLVVMYMGLRLMLSREVAGPAINVNIPLMKTIGMACVVTWFNPQAIIDVSLLLGSFRVALPPEESGLFLWGVVCASCLWFLSLTTISSLFKNAAAITRKSILARPLGLKAVTWFSLPQYTQNVLCHNSTNDQPSFTP